MYRVFSRMWVTLVTTPVAIIIALIVTTPGKDLEVFRLIFRLGYILFGCFEIAEFIVRPVKSLDTIDIDLWWGKHPVSEGVILIGVGIYSFFQVSAGAGFLLMMWSAPYFSTGDAAKSKGQRDLMYRNKKWIIEIFLAMFFAGVAVALFSLAIMIYRDNLDMCPFDLQILEPLPKQGEWQRILPIWFI